MAGKTRRYTVLITGAASGIGLGFVKHYLNDSRACVLACDINDIPPEIPGPGRLSTYKTDFGSEYSIQDTVKSIVRSLKSGGLSNEDLKVNLVIHSAGIRGLVSEVVNSKPDDVAAAETLQVMNSETMERTYRINTIGTFVLMQALANEGLFYEATEGNESFTQVVIMTSRMGSISYNTMGAGYAYRASKAALNALVRSFTIDLPHVMFALVHPGRVETGLTKCREEGAIEVEESINDMLESMKTLKLEDSGKYCDRFGKSIGW